MAHLPLPVDRLDDVRIAVRRVGSQLHQESDFIQTGSGKPSQQTWTGMTIFQVNGETRKEMGMTSHDVQDARQLGRKQRAAANKKIQKNKSEIKERELSLEHRLLFQAAKQKELSSFFQNGVWPFQTTKEASPERTLTSRMLLKWSKNADGSPRAKARLVVRGYADVDALAGSLETASPASTRLGKTLFLSLSSCLGWTGWSADVSTAFLQGLPQERKLWVKLPADALAFLGADSDTRMFLHKPVYGQLDAPRRWFLEASSRLRKLGWKQHSLDPCFWMLFEPQSQKLVGLLCLHVDDMLGGGDSLSETYQHMEKEIKTMFNFRTWQQDESFEYCGANMSRETNGTWVVSHEKYPQKIKPLTMEKGRPTHSPMTPKEQSLLRGLLGSLQWPAVQSSPHLLASTSLLSGEMATGLAAPMVEANRLLKFAKQNSDSVLKYPPLGELDDLRLSCMFDAAHGVRHDGFLCLLTHKQAFEGVETPYHVLEWKSFKLPRVARSSLAAEAQAAGAAADSVEFIVRFWNELMNPGLDLKTNLAMDNSSLQPVLITDAKALYDTYHRDAFNHGSNDKRTALEVKVTRQQVESFGGKLKWVSSERQYGDGLTKLSARQLLADRLRHGAIKYTWDPEYVAAKKKTVENRWSSQHEFTNTKTHNNARNKHQTNTQGPQQTTKDGTPSMDKQAELESRSTSTEQFAAREAIEATSCSPGRTRTRAAGHGYGFLALMALLWTPPAAALPVSNETHAAEGRWPLLQTVVLLLTAFVLGAWFARRYYLKKIRNLERSVAEALSVQDQAVASMDLSHQRTYECQVANRELRGAMDLQGEELALTRDRLRVAEERLAFFERDVITGIPLTEEEVTGRRLAIESESRAALADAKAILDRAMRELNEHAQICPIRDEIFIAPRGRVWHLRPDCRVLVNQAHGERSYEWCTACASMDITPNRLHPNTQRTLADDIGMFLAHHGTVLYEARTRNELFLLPWMQGWFGPWPATMRAAGLVPEGQG